jgi:glycosyltransferase involved in cell wall biosynthesis
MVNEVGARERDQAPIDLLTPYFQGKPYHALHSGYETLTSFIGRSSVFYVGDFPKITRLSYPFRLFRILPKSYRSMHAELTALNGLGRILHHLYGEDTLWLSLLRQSARRPIVATFHRPPRVLDATMPFFWKRAVSKLSGIIVLSPEQLGFIQSVCRSTKTRVSLIPHGIDTDYFTPGNNERSKDIVISVGNYLRDHKTLVEAMRVVSERAPTLKLILVSVYAPVLNMPAANISSRTAISDDELLNYYRQASFMVLPYAALAASNAMMEAMACGMAVICPRFESARYYLGLDLATMYEPGNPKDLADKILWLHENDRERRKLGSLMRTRAELFSWPKIASLVRKFYDQIIEP